MASPAAKFRETLIGAYRRFNALERGEKRCFGVTMSQCFTLELLHQQGALSVGELSDQLGLEPSTVTRVVDVLVRNGMLRRARDEGRDRRRVFVSLSARGRALARRLEDCADAYCERILERIEPARREDVIQALGVLVDAIDDLPGACD